MVLQLPYIVYASFDKTRGVTGTQIKNTEGQVRSGWKIVIAFVMMNIFTGLFMIPIMLMNMKLENNGFSINLSADRPLTLLLLMLAQVLGAIVTVWICLKKEKKKWRDVGFSSIPPKEKTCCLDWY